MATDTAISGYIRLSYIDTGLVCLALDLILQTPNRRRTRVGLNVKAADTKPQAHAGWVKPQAHAS